MWFARPCDLTRIEITFFPLSNLAPLKIATEPQGVTNYNTEPMVDSAAILPRKSRRPALAKRSRGSALQVGYRQATEIFIPRGAATLHELLFHNSRLRGISAFCWLSGELFGTLPERQPARGGQGLSSCAHVVSHSAALGAFHPFPFE